MQSLSRGWSFLQEAWKMALKDRDLLKPSLYALIASSIVGILGLIPLIGAGLLLGESTGIGQTVMVVIGALLLFVQFVVRYVFSGMTVYLGPDDISLWEEADVVREAVYPVKPRSLVILFARIKD